MPTKLIEEGDPLDDDPGLNERLRTMADDDPEYVAWYRKVYGSNPPTKKPVRVKRAKGSSHTKK